jgi:uncharacterized protein (TIGR00730 family)
MELFMAKNFKATRAYKNFDFLNSHEAREIRVLSEFLEPEKRFNDFDVTDTFVFFGSARIKSEKEAMKDLKALQRQKNKVRGYDKKLKAAEKMLELSWFYEQAAELAGRLTEWSMSLKNSERKFIVASGGGPGIMEAANKGATLAGGKSIGMNISLPFEQYVNEYVSTELAFEFHYFFIRKFWLIYLAKALIVFPGGFGTLDEMFEVLTLIQTKKISKKMKVIIFGTDYWKKIVDFDALVENEVIQKKDLNLFDFCDTVDDAFEKITTCMKKHYL